MTDDFDFDSLPSIDDTPLTFGKWKGSTPRYVSQHDPGYIIWMYENVKSMPCSPALYQQVLDNRAFPSFVYEAQDYDEADEPF